MWLKCLHSSLLERGMRDRKVLPPLPLHPLQFLQSQKQKDATPSAPCREWFKPLLSFLYSIYSTTVLSPEAVNSHMHLRHCCLRSCLWWCNCPLFPWGLLPPSPTSGIWAKGRKLSHLSFHSRARRVPFPLFFAAKMFPSPS